MENRICVYLADGVAKWVRNTGQVEQILIEDHHPALVSEELYNAVQELLDDYLRRCGNRSDYTDLSETEGGKSLAMCGRMV